MDYHSMKRKELQALCKKHNIPANSTNSVMADKLSELLNDSLKSSAEIVEEKDSGVGRKQAKYVAKKVDDANILGSISEGEEIPVKLTRSRVQTSANDSVVPANKKKRGRSELNDGKKENAAVKEREISPVRVTRLKAQTLGKDSVVPHHEGKRGRKAVKVIEKENEPFKESEVSPVRVTRLKAQTMGNDGVIPLIKKKQGRRAVKVIEKENEAVKEIEVSRIRVTRSKVQKLDDGAPSDLNPQVKKNSVRGVAKDKVNVESSKDIGDNSVTVTRSREQQLKNDIGNPAADPQVEKKRARRELKVADRSSKLTVTSSNAVSEDNQEVPKRKSSRNREVEFSDEDGGENLKHGERKTRSKYSVVEESENEKQVDKGLKRPRRNEVNVEDSTVLNKNIDKKEVVTKGKVTRSMAQLATTSLDGNSKSETETEVRGHREPKLVHQLKEPLEHAGRRNANQIKIFMPTPEYTEAVSRLEEPVNYPARKGTRRKSVMQRAEEKGNDKPKAGQGEMVKESVVAELPNVPSRRSRRQTVLLQPVVPTVDNIGACNTVALKHSEEQSGNLPVIDEGFEDEDPISDKIASRNLMNAVAIATGKEEVSASDTDVFGECVDMPCGMGNDAGASSNFDAALYKTGSSADCHVSVQQSSFRIKLKEMEPQLASSTSEGVSGSPDVEKHLTDGIFDAQIAEIEMESEQEPLACKDIFQNPSGDEHEIADSGEHDLEDDRLSTQELMNELDDVENRVLAKSQQSNFNKGMEDQHEPSTSEGVWASFGVEEHLTDERFNAQIEMESEQEPLTFKDITQNPSGDEHEVANNDEYVIEDDRVCIRELMSELDDKDNRVHADIDILQTHNVGSCDVADDVLEMESEQESSANQDVSQSPVVGKDNTKNVRADTQKELVSQLDQSIADDILHGPTVDEMKSEQETLTCKDILQNPSVDEPDVEDDRVSTEELMSKPDDEVNRVHVIIDMLKSPDMGNCDVADDALETVSAQESSGNQDGRQSPIAGDDSTGHIRVDTPKELETSIVTDDILHAHSVVVMESEGLLSCKDVLQNPSVNDHEVAEDGENDVGVGAQELMSKPEDGVRVHADIDQLQNPDMGISDAADDVLEEESELEPSANQDASQSPVVGEHDIGLVRVDTPKELVSQLVPSIADDILRGHAVDKMESEEELLTCKDVLQNPSVDELELADNGENDAKDVGVGEQESMSGPDDEVRVHANVNAHQSPHMGVCDVADDMLETEAEQEPSANQDASQSPEVGEHDIGHIRVVTLMELVSQLEPSSAHDTFHGHAVDERQSEEKLITCKENFQDPSVDEYELAGNGENDAEDDRVCAQELMDKPDDEVRVHANIDQLRSPDMGISDAADDVLEESQQESSANQNASQRPKVGDHHIQHISVDTPKELMSELVPSIADDILHGHAVDKMEFEGELLTCKEILQNSSVDEHELADNGENDAGDDRVGEQEWMSEPEDKNRVYANVDEHQSPQMGVCDAADALETETEQEPSANQDASQSPEVSEHDIGHIRVVTPMELVSQLKPSSADDILHGHALDVMESEEELFTCKENLQNPSVDEHELADNGENDAEGDGVGEQELMSKPDDEVRDHANVDELWSPDIDNYDVAEDALEMESVQEPSANQDASQSPVVDEHDVGHIRVDTPKELMSQLEPSIADDVLRGFAMDGNYIKDVIVTTKDIEAEPVKVSVGNDIFDSPAMDGCNVAVDGVHAEELNFEQEPLITKLPHNVLELPGLVKDGSVHATKEIGSDSKSSPAGNVLETPVLSRDVEDEDSNAKKKFEFELKPSTGNHIFDIAVLDRDDVEDDGFNVTLELDSDSKPSTTDDTESEPIPSFAYKELEFEPEPSNDKDMLETQASGVLDAVNDSEDAQDRDFEQELAAVNDVCPVMDRQVVGEDGDNTQNENQTAVSEDLFGSAVYESAVVLNVAGNEVPHDASDGRASFELSDLSKRKETPQSPSMDGNSVTAEGVDAQVESMLNSNKDSVSNSSADINELGNTIKAMDTQNEIIVCENDLNSVDLPGFDEGVLSKESGNVSPKSQDFGSTCSPNREKSNSSFKETDDGKDSDLCIIMPGDVSLPQVKNSNDLAQHFPKENNQHSFIPMAHSPESESRGFSMINGQRTEGAVIVTENDFASPDKIKQILATVNHDLDGDTWMDDSSTHGVDELDCQPAGAMGVHGSPNREESSPITFEKEQCFAPGDDTISDPRTSLHDDDKNNQDDQVSDPFQTNAVASSSMEGSSNHASALVYSATNVEEASVIVVGEKSIQDVDIKEADSNIPIKSVDVSEEFFNWSEDNSLQALFATPNTTRQIKAGQDETVGSAFRNKCRDTGRNEAPVHDFHHQWDNESQKVSDFDDEAQGTEQVQETSVVSNFGDQYFNEKVDCSGGMFGKNDNVFLKDDQLDQIKQHDMLIEAARTSDHDASGLAELQDIARMENNSVPGGEFDIKEEACLKEHLSKSKSEIGNDLAFDKVIWENLDAKVEESNHSLSCDQTNAGTFMITAATPKKLVPTSDMKENTKSLKGEHTARSTVRRRALGDLQGK